MPHQYRVGLHDCVETHRFHCEERRAFAVQPLCRIYQLSRKCGQGLPHPNGDTDAHGRTDEERHPRACTGLVRLFGVHGFGVFGREEPHRLQTFFDGNLWIITRRKKTNTESNIRLLDVPKRIIEKYKGLARDGHVFPVPSNGSCNKILKEIGRQCGFKVRLTYHVARHTNATTVLLSHGVPIETVSRLLGHTNIKTTQIYAKITAQKISQDMETLSHKLEDMEKNICRAI